MEDEKQQAVKIKDQIQKGNGRREAAMNGTKERWEDSGGGKGRVQGEETEREEEC